MSITSKIPGFCHSVCRDYEPGEEGLQGDYAQLVLTGEIQS